MTDDAPCTCKVTRTRDEFDLEMDDDSLVAAWQDGTSVRELTRSFNEAIIEARLDRLEGSSTTWNRLPIYDALKTDELSEADVIETKRELERHGIDPDEFRSTFISHQTMYRHLTSCLDASASSDPTPEERREKARDTVYALQRRTTLVTESTIETLQNTGTTDLGDPDVLVDIQILCRECGYSADFDTALTDGCNCP